MMETDRKSIVQEDAEKASVYHEDITKDLAHQVGLTPEEQVLEKKLRRRIDMLIMPLVILVYLMNYIDR